MTEHKLRNLPIVILSLVCLQLASAWYFARYVHYHDQRQILGPAHYTAEVVPAADGAPGDPDQFRLSEDGRYYVRIATLGTAHHMARTSSDLLPPLFFALLGLAASIAMRIKQPAEPTPEPAP